MLDELIRAGRDWLADCGYRVPALDLDVVLKVDRNFDGGWPEFVRADPDVFPATVYAELEDRWGLCEMLYPLPDPTPTGDPLPIRG